MTASATSIEADRDLAVRAAGLLVLLAMAAGALSVVPVLERHDWLARLPAARHQVLRGAGFQLLMVPAYVGFALLLHPALRRVGSTAALGFVCLRVAAAGLQLVGVLLLALFPLLADVAAGADAERLAQVELLGELLRRGRDLVNHVGMVVALGCSDLLLFGLLRRGRLVPGWLTTWGLAGAALAVGASLLVLAGTLDVVAVPYLALNVPLALQNLVLAGWLVRRGLAGRQPVR